MARPTSGWEVRLPPGRTIYLVRFTHQGRRVERSTRESTPEGAAREAARIYAEVTLGQEKTPVEGGADALLRVVEAWLNDYGRSHDEGTTSNAKGYAVAWARVLGGLEAMTEAGYARYMRERIARVSRSTLRKELSALRQFAAWLKVERGISLPPVPGVPKRGHPGARAKNARRRQATILSPEEVERILEATAPGWRGFFRVCWETSLRPFSTVAALRAPDHYAGGDIFIAREIDKAKYERTVPVTPAAREVLDAAAARGPGPLFPDVDKDGARWALDTAVKQAGIDRPVSIYDLRHSRISFWANSGRPLAGVSFLAGHLHISTTARYVTASAAAARAVLEEPDSLRPRAPETLARRRTSTKARTPKTSGNAAPA